MPISGLGGPVAATAGRGTGVSVERLGWRVRPKPQLYQCASHAKFQLWGILEFVVDESEAIPGPLADNHFEPPTALRQTAACAICASPLAGAPKVRLGNAHLRACESCGSWTYFPRLNPVDQAAIHDTEAYFEHPYFALRRGLSAALVRRCRGIFERLETAVDSAALRGERFLDIGCDTGAFLDAARQEFEIKPVGIDTASRAVAAARERGIEAYQTSIQEAPEHLRDFQAITAIDLIEHVTDPADFLREIRKRLRPGGVVYLETPNIDSIVYRIGSSLNRWTHGRRIGMLERIFPPQHVQYFTSASLAGLARSVGFEMVRIDNRVLPWSDIGAAAPVRAGMSAVQMLDRLAGTCILICALLRRPTAGIDLGQE